MNLLTLQVPHRGLCSGLAPRPESLAQRVDPSLWNPVSHA